MLPPQVKSPEDTSNFTNVDAALSKLAESAKTAKVAYADGMFSDF